jgi:hypothetical protein
MIISSRQSLRTTKPSEKIDRALQLLAVAQESNSGLTDVFERSGLKLEGHESHLKAIEFDRPTRDVSAHGTALRQQADGASQELQQGEPKQDSLESLAEQVSTLIESALEDVEGKNYQAASNLREAQFGMDFALDSTIPVQRNSLKFANKTLVQDLDPYLTEVEEDEPGRDVGRFADDIADMWKSAESRIASAPIYIDSTHRSFESTAEQLKAAREAL